MALTKRTVTIVGASLVSVGMITGAFALSGPLPFASLVKKVDAQSTEQLLKAFAAKDTDSDGLPDWEESLYGTDANNPQSVQAGVSDKEAVAQGLVKPRFVTQTSAASQDAADTEVPGIDAAPDSVTDRFAQAFFKNYMATRGEEKPTEEQVLKFAEDAVADLTASNEHPQAFNITDVRTGSVSMREYIASVERAFLKYPTKAGSPELEYVTAAVSGNDTSSLPKARAIAASYINQSEELMTLTVPAEARLAHLALANSVHRLGDVTNDMAAMDTDPMLGMLGIMQYQSAAYDAIVALASYSSLISNAGVSFVIGETGYDFANRAQIVTRLLSAVQ